MPRIEQWGVIEAYDGDPRFYKLPELTVHILSGQVFDHPRCVQGQQVTTTPIMGVRNGRIVTRSGTEYELGTPHPDYLKLNPDATVKLLEFASAMGCPLQPMPEGVKVNYPLPEQEER